jgi:hypothetical protein
VSRGEGGRFCFGVVVVVVVGGGGGGGGGVVVVVLCVGWLDVVGCVCVGECGWVVYAPPPPSSHHIFTICNIHVHILCKKKFII